MSYLKCIRSICVLVLFACRALAQYPTLTYSTPSDYPLTEEIGYTAHAINTEGQPVAGVVINWPGIVSALGDTPPPYVAGGAHYHNSTIPQAGYLVGSKTVATTTCTTNSGGECGATAVFPPWSGYYTFTPCGESGQLLTQCYNIQQVIQDNGNTIPIEFLTQCPASTGWKTYGTSSHEFLEFGTSVWMCSALHSIALAFSNKTGGHTFTVTRMTLPLAGPVDDLGVFWDLSMLDSHVGTPGLHNFDALLLTGTDDTQFKSAVTTHANSTGSSKCTVSSGAPLYPAGMYHVSCY